MSCTGKPMTCGHVPAWFTDEHDRLAYPLPRWAILPGDPPPLRRWLREQAAVEEAS